MSFRMVNVLCNSGTNPGPKPIEAVGTGPTECSSFFRVQRFIVLRSHWLMVIIVHNNSVLLERLI